jgi:hypothetical protein
MERQPSGHQPKEGVSMQDIEHFAKKHTTEVFSILALIIAMVSSAFHFFTGPGLTIVFTTVGAILAILFPAPIQKGLRQLYQFTYRQDKTTEIVLGAVKIIVAIFIPFLYFGLIGLLAGGSYHYHIHSSRHARFERRDNNTHSNHTGDEHD